MSAVSCCCIALYILHLGFFIVCKPLFLVASSFSLFFFSSQLLTMDFFFSCIALFLLEWLFFFSLSFPLFSRHRCNGDCRGSGPLSGRVPLPFASAPPHSLQLCPQLLLPLQALPARTPPGEQPGDALSTRSGWRLLRPWEKRPVTGGPPVLPPGGLPWPPSRCSVQAVRPSWRPPG